ncbi:MAG: hypothetical protein AB7G37_17850 [Solirubrobacteraceae bacterium]
MTSARRALPAVLLAPVLAVAVSVPAADAASPSACRSGTIASLAADREADVTAALEYGSVVRTCRDLNGDGRRDALFIITGGGTGGAFWGGIVQGTSGNRARLGAWVGGQSKMSYGFYKGRPALAWPVYRRADAGCCPTGGWKVRRFIRSGKGFRPLKTLRKRSNTYPLKLKP